MTRKLVLSLLATTAVAGPALALSACGAEDAVGVDVAKASTATAEKGTARLAMTVKASGLGLPAPLTFKADGVTALAKPEMDIGFDLGPVASLVGVGGQDLETRVIVKGKDLRVKVPELPGIAVPGGKEWVGLDLKQVVTSLGLDGDSLGRVFSVDPAAQLRALKAAKGMKEVGREDVAGASTTHYKGTFKFSDYIAGLPAAEREAAEKAIKSLDSLPGGGTGADSFDVATPTEIWTDDEGVVRRMRQSAALPAAGGSPAGKFDITYELRDFGAAFPSGAPSDDEVYDATQAVGGLLGSIPGAPAAAQTD